MSLTRYIPALFLTTATVLLFPLFFIVNKADESTIGTSVALLLLPIFAFYSFRTGRKRRGVKRTCFVTFGAVFTGYFLSALFSPYACGLRGHEIIRKLAKGALQEIHAAQVDFISKKGKYAKSLGELGLSYDKQLSYKFFINDEDMLNRFSVKIPASGFIAIARAERIEAIRPTELSYYCEDVWIIGSEIPLTNIKPGFPCKDKSFVSRMDMYRLGALGFIAFIFMLERVQHVRQRKRSIAISD